MLFYKLNKSVKICSKNPYVGPVLDTLIKCSALISSSILVLLTYKESCNLLSPKAQLCASVGSELETLQIRVDMLSSCASLSCLTFFMIPNSFYFHLNSLSDGICLSQGRLPYCLPASIFFKATIVSNFDFPLFTIANFDFPPTNSLLLTTTFPFSFVCFFLLFRF